MIAALEQAVSYLLYLADYQQPLDLRLTYIPDGLLSIQPYKQPKEQTQSSGSSAEPQDDGNHTPSEQEKSSSVPPGKLPDETCMIYMANTVIKKASALFRSDGSVTILPGSYLNPTPNTTIYSDESTTKLFAGFEREIEEMTEKGKIQLIDGVPVLQVPHDISVTRANTSALSRAASFLMRCSINGWDAWRDANGNKLPREEETSNKSQKSQTNSSSSGKDTPKTSRNNAQKPQSEKSSSKPKGKVTKWLSVIFPSGKRIKGKTTKETFVKFVEQIGPEDVEALNITHLGFPLIQREPFEKEYIRKQQVHLSSGAYLNTCGDTTRVADLIDKIASGLGIPIRTEIEVEE